MCFGKLKKKRKYDNQNIFIFDDKSGNDII